MSEPPALPSALGIEAVEWLAQGADSLTVRVGGRWRRRRPSISGQPLLVIEAGMTRQRFPAMPEPPGLTGAAPGTWQMSFSVPAELARRPGARAWLQLGSVVVPLPVPVAEDPSAADDETLAQRRIRAAELAAESATLRVTEARAEAQELADRVAGLELELAEQTELAQASDRARRTAEQREHAERALRLELEERLAAGGIPAVPAIDAGDRGLRIEELEDELEQLRRAFAEAEQVAAAAEVARRHAEQQLAASRQARPPAPFADSLRAELGLARGLAPVAPVSVAARPVPDDRVRLGRERQLADTRGRSPGPAASVGEPDPRIASTLAQLGEELVRLRTQIAEAVAERANAERRAAELERALKERSARSAHILEVTEQLRAEIAEVRAGTEPAGASEDDEEAQAVPEPEVEPGPVQAERLAEALTRLRESAPAPAPSPSLAAPGIRSDRWLAPALRNVSRRDRDGAAALLGALLVASVEEARDASGLMALGPARRRWRLGVTRLRGRSERFAALRKLLRSPTGLQDLSLEPSLAFVLAAAMIRPRWTLGERFTLAYDAGPYMHVRDGSPVSVTEEPLVAVATTIVCPPEVLLAVLGSAVPAGAEVSVSGQQRPLELVQAWLQRAQGG
jgi:hypothetical protein